MKDLPLSPLPYHRALAQRVSQPTRDYSATDRLQGSDWQGSSSDLKGSQLGKPMKAVFPKVKLRGGGTL